MIYEFKIIKTSEIIEVNIKMSEYDAFVTKRKDLERYIGTAPAVTYEGRTFGSGVETRQPDGFKEVLAKIGENHPISPLADRYRKNKTIKELRTKAVVTKHRQKSVDATKERIKKIKNKVVS